MLRPGQPLRSRIGFANGRQTAIVAPTAKDRSMTTLRRIGVLLAGAIPCWLAPSAGAATLDGSCHMLAKAPDGKIEMVADTAQVDAAISASPLRPFRAPDGYSDASILCVRDSLIPGGNDYRVLQLGYSL